MWPPVGVEQAAHAPDHVGHGAIDEQRPEREKDRHGAELHALGEGAGDERRGDDGEHELVDHVGLLGDGGGVVGIGREPDAAQEDVLEAADEAVAVAEGQRVADDGPENGDQAHHGEALHHGAEDVLAANQAAVEERQAGAGHQQHQRGGDQHPGVVGGRSGRSGRPAGGRRSGPAWRGRVRGGWAGAANGQDESCERRDSGLRVTLRMLTSLRNIASAGPKHGIENLRGSSGAESACYRRRPPVQAEQ